MDDEAQLMLAESLLQLLEVDRRGDGRAGPVGRRTLPGAQEALDAALASGYPDQAGLESLRRLGAGPLCSQSAQLGRLGAARGAAGPHQARASTPTTTSSATAASDGAVPEKVAAEPGASRFKLCRELRKRRPRSGAGAIL